MSRDEALTELGRMLKDHSLPVVDVVRAVLGFLRGSREPWTDVAVFVKKASWGEFAPASSLDPADSQTEARYEIFRTTLVRDIVEFWNKFMARMNED